MVTDENAEIQISNKVQEDGKKVDQRPKLLKLSVWSTQRLYNIFLTYLFLKLVSDGSKRLCKNVLRLNRVIFEKMNVFRIFEIDSCFPNKLTSLTAKYVIVLIQFALS